MAVTKKRSMKVRKTLKTSKLRKSRVSNSKKRLSRKMKGGGGWGRTRGPREQEVRTKLRPSEDILPKSKGVFSIATPLSPQSLKVKEAYKLALEAAKKRNKAERKKDKSKPFQYVDQVNQATGKTTRYAISLEPKSETAKFAYEKAVKELAEAVKSHPITQAQSPYFTAFEGSFKKNPLFRDPSNTNSLGSGRERTNLGSSGKLVKENPTYNFPLALNSTYEDPGNLVLDERSGTLWRSPSQRSSSSNNVEEEIFAVPKNLRKQRSFVLDRSNEPSLKSLLAANEERAKSVLESKSYKKAFPITTYNPETGDFEIAPQEPETKDPLYASVVKTTGQKQTVRNPLSSLKKKQYNNNTGEEEML
jgi:hypothetical protein